MNRPVKNTEVGTVILKFPKNKYPRPNCFTGKFYQTFKEELTPTLQKIFPKIAEEGTLPNSQYSVPRNMSYL